MQLGDPAGADRAVAQVGEHAVGVTLVAVGAVAAIGLLLDPMVRGHAAAPVVFAQMLAASTGFAVRARRGHLDLLLTGGQPRLDAAAAHLVMSIAPGVAVWLSVRFLLTVRSGAPVPATQGAGAAAPGAHARAARRGDLGAVNDGERRGRRDRGD